MKQRCFVALGPLLGAALLSGCAVYVPITPGTPLLRDKGETEVTATIRSFSTLETSAAWAPVPRLLVTAEGALQQSEGSETRNSVTTNYSNLHLQGGLGLGTYRLLGPDQSTYLGVLGGVGVASANVYDSNLDGFFLLIPLFSPLVHYEATYQRYYAQGYVAKQTSSLSYGASVRGTFVHYSTLLRNGTPIAAPTHFFLEPHLFLRFGKGALQGMATLGVSTPGHTDRSNPDNANLAPSSMLFSLGVVLRPHLLFHRYNPATD